MALVREMEQDNGVVLSYHRVCNLHILTNDKNIIEVASYIDRAQRERERAWREDDAARIAAGEKDPADRTEEEEALLATAQGPLNVLIEYPWFIVPYDQSMTVDSAYEYLKTLPEFEGAEDA